jgi:hypothetical protein
MVLVKWTLLATTGSSQPLIIFHIPAMWFGFQRVEGFNDIGWGEGLTLEDPGGLMNEDYA